MGILVNLPYRLLAVDPATGKSGWAILDIISLQPLRVQIIATGQLDGDKLLKEKKEMALIFRRQFCIVDALHDEYVRLITLYGPQQVVSEGSFGHLHLAALISLTLAIHELRKASRLTLNKEVVEMPPTISKKCATGSGGADKDHMRLAYQTTDMLQGIVADDLISEHEIDAIFHGIAYIRVHIIGDIQQVSAKERRDKKRLKQKEKEEKLKLAA